MSFVRFTPLHVRLLGLFLALLSCASSFAARIDTVAVWSDSMRKTIGVTVIVPATADVVPVVYLLHGYDGDHTTWLGRTKPSLPSVADSLGVMFVCPDGGNSWYFDSPVDTSSCYETFVTGELVAYIDSTYRTLPCREARAVCGYSMGGHGALWCAVRHKDVFAAAACLSGGVDLTGYPDSWDIAKVLGRMDANPRLWRQSSVISLVGEMDGLAIVIDCGTEDFFHRDNLRLHQLLTRAGVEHTYYSFPGGHTHDYWDAALDRAMPVFIETFSHAVVGGAGRAE